MDLIYYLSSEFAFGSLRDVLFQSDPPPPKKKEKKTTLSEPENFSSCRWGLACAEPEAIFSFSKFLFKLQKGFLSFLEEQQKVIFNKWDKVASVKESVSLLVELYRL